MDIQIKTLKRNLFLVKCLNNKAISIFNKIVFNRDDTSTSAVVSAYIKNSLTLYKLQNCGLKYEYVKITPIAKKTELEYYERVHLGL